MITKLLSPPGRQCFGSDLNLPTRASPRPKSNPSIFNDAMTVRLRVFVDEQKCSPESELDEDDARSWHWVMYAKNTADTEVNPESVSSSECDLEPGCESQSSQLLPIGVVRLVPPPHAPHHNHTEETTWGSDSVKSNSNSNSNNTQSKYDLSHEPYIKLTRVAILHGYRGRGLAKRMVDLALTWAAEHPVEIDQAYSSTVLASDRESSVRSDNTAQRWSGLVLVHAQTDKEGLYVRWGFETDPTLGKWDEEGIEHVGMWRRIEVKRSSNEEINRQ